VCSINSGFSPGASLRVVCKRRNAQVPTMLATVMTLM